MAAAAADRLDRVGIGWRPPLAGSIFAHRAEIDVVEVIADNYVAAGRGGISALRRLCSLVPTILHGVGLGLASSSPVEQRRLDAIARLVDLVGPEGWSEHLAFVRAGGIELGHLAAPPRTEQTIASVLRNIDAARSTVGALPSMENVATIVAPPCSTLDEPAWLTGVIAGAGCPFLLDLHNLHANAVNAGADAMEWLGRLPLDRTHMVHIAGGQWIDEPGSRGTRRRWLDDHRHPAPAAVFDLLEEVGARTRHTLTVILERDGDYPPFGDLLAELRAARAALARGRARRDREGRDGRHAA